MDVLSGNRTGRLFNFAVPTLMILVVAILTVSSQMLKAILINPVESLRYE
jgi:hypothetical protein